MGKARGGHFEEREYSEKNYYDGTRHFYCVRGQSEKCLPTEVGHEPSRASNMCVSSW